ncbi:MAG: MFS transporter [Anaerolineae bacterium]
MTAAARPLINDRREIFGWAMYDWANSAFSTTVVTVFLGPYLTAITRAAADAQGLVYLFGTPIRYDSFFTYCISASVLLQVTFLPILGALADYSHLRKQLLQLFCVIGSVATIAMFGLGPGLHWLGGGLFIIANLAFGASMVFYNSYLPNIASEDRRDRVSSFGWAMGYLGGGLLLLLNLVLYLFSEQLGLGGDLAARISLASAGVWWLGFSFITFATLRSRHAVRPLPRGETYFSIGFKQLARLMEAPTRLVTVLMLLPMVIPLLFVLGLPVTVILAPAVGPLLVLVMFIARKARTLPEAMKYLVAYLFYNDGVQTVIAVSAIFAANELKMSSTNLILVILMIQFVAFAGALGFGRLAERVGAKRAILLSLVIWSAVALYAYGGMQSTALVLGMEQRQLEFWLLGFVIALVLGGSQALSRSLFAQMIPPEQEAEFYSFYEVSERGTSWLGTFVFGLVNQLFGSLRMGILSVIVFFIIGLILLPFVNVPKAMAEARLAGSPTADR